LQQWEQDSRWLQQQARDGALTLAQRFAEKVVHRQVQVDPSVILDQLSHGLSQIMRPLEVTVHLHPDDRPIVEEAMADLIQRFDQVQQLHLVEDSHIQRGGCHLTYGQGGIDLTLEKQLQRMSAAILPGQEAGDAEQQSAGTEAVASDGPEAGGEDEALQTESADE
jgi:flagellar assembly protein FliH